MGKRVFISVSGFTASSTNENKTNRSVARTVFPEEVMGLHSDAISPATDDMNVSRRLAGSALQLVGRAISTSRES